MAKWNLPEGKIYTQTDLDAAVTAALREAADVAWRFYAKGQVTKPSDIKALLPDAGAALDRALAAERERDAKVAETHPMRFAGQTEDDVRAAIAAAIRAQKENPDG